MFLMKTKVLRPFLDVREGLQAAQFPPETQ
jgi:hypothetical protein